MSADVADKLVEVVVLDGDLKAPERLLEALRNPPGRSPATWSLDAASAIAKLEDGEALTVIRAVLDSATCGFFALLDQDFKNSGLHASFAVDEASLDSRQAAGRFWESYRRRVAPGGTVLAEEALR